MRSLTPAVGASLLIAAAVPAAAQTLILDDFDGDNSDELFGPQGLLVIVQSDEFPTLVADDALITPGDIGGVRYIDNEADINLTVGQWPNDAGGGVELGLDFNDLRIIGFEADFRDVSTDFPFGFTIFDGGPSGTPERKIASVDITIPAGDSTFRTLFSDPIWFIESGFEFEDIGSVYYGLNIDARFPREDIVDKVEQVDLKFVELRAVLACDADVNLDGDVNDSDFFAWAAAFTAPDRTPAEEAACDVNRDGTCSDSDFFAWVTAFIDGC